MKDNKNVKMVQFNDEINHDNQEFIEPLNFHLQKQKQVNFYDTDDNYNFN